MKKICMVVPSFDAKGGIASVVSGYRGSELENRYRIRYVQTYCDGNKWNKLCKAVAAYAVFIKELLFWKPDAVHIHSSFGASFYRKLPFIYLADFCGIPVVNHIHGSEIDRFYRKTSDKEKRLKRKTFGKCAKIIALSEHWREQFSEFANKEKIDVIANYSTLQDVRTETRENTKNVLFLGFLSELKGCFDIPEIAHIVKQQVGNVRFVLAGSGSETDLQEIRKRAQQWDVEDNLIFPGWVRRDEKDQLLREASIYFLPSYTEGMPMSVLEAMGYHLPIVSTNVGGIPTLVKNGQNGYLYEPGDVQGMAGAITAILLDADKQMHMGEASAAVVREGYSLEQHIAKLSCVYENLAEKKTMNVFCLIYKTQEIIRKIPYKFLREPVLKKAMASCGKNVHIAEKCDIRGIENISIGHGSSIGRGSILWTTQARILIGNKVITGPNITIITGNHRIDLIGRYMADVTADEKRPEDDQDVIIRDDVWLGANTTILKGVTIAEGCVIAAGAVVTKSTEPYGVYAGVPAKRLADRFTEREVQQHIAALSNCD